MSDWMKVDKAWWYTYHRRAPIKGKVVHTVNGSNGLAWFVPDGDSWIVDGYTVLDEEGVAGAQGVWYTEEVPMYEAKHAMVKYWTDQLNKTKLEARQIKDVLVKLGFNPNEEDDAE